MMGLCLLPLMPRHFPPQILKDSKLALCLETPDIEHWAYHKFLTNQPELVTPPDGLQRMSQSFADANTFRPFS
ncbi:unnamed protein product, partial [Staurois parvus]